MPNIQTEFWRYIPAGGHIGQRNLRVKHRPLSVRAIYLGTVYELIVASEVGILPEETAIGRIEVGLTRVDSNLRQQLVGFQNRIFRVGLQGLILLDIGRRTPPTASAIRQLRLLQKLCRRRTSNAA